MVNSKIMKRFLAFLLSITIILIIYCGTQIFLFVMNVIYGITWNGITCVSNSSYCPISIMKIVLNSILLCFEAPVYFIWLVLCLNYIIRYVRWDTTVTQIESENITLQTTLTEKTLELVNLQGQLNTVRNYRRPTGIEECPFRSKEGNENKPQLPGTTSIDYQTVQYIPFRIDNSN